MRHDTLRRSASAAQSPSVSIACNFVAANVSFIGTEGAFAAILANDGTAVIAAFGIRIQMMTIFLLAAMTSSALKTQKGTDLCQVWDREQAFAHAVERHDEKAFRSFIDPSAVFLDGAGNRTIGVEAIVRDWAPLLEGHEIQLRWHAKDVAVDVDRGIAVSRGPFTLRGVAGSKYGERLAGGTFSSVWVKAPDGSWRILFDAGSGSRPMAEEEAANMMGAVSASCPYTVPYPEKAQDKSVPGVAGNQQ